jgi:hypothetical protein
MVTERPARSNDTAAETPAGPDPIMKIIELTPVLQKSEF